MQPLNRRSIPLALGLLAGLAAPAAGATINGETLIRFFGRTHPILVHFPIALLIVAAVIELLALLRRRRATDAATAKGRVSSPTAVVCLTFGAGFTIAAAAAGWFLAANDPPGSTEDDHLFWHRWLGVGAAGLSVLVLLLGGMARLNGRFGAVYRVVLILLAAGVGFTGHLGGEMVYGEGYLLSAFSPDADPGAPPRAAPADDTPAGRAAAVFARSCVECHGPRKQKGKLRLDDIEALAVRDDLITPGQPDESEVYLRITLPKGDRDLMPSGGRDPIPDADIAAIRSWILFLGGEPMEPEDTPTRAAAPEPVEAPAVYELTESQRADRDRAIAAVRTAGGFASVEFEGADLVDVNFAVLGSACTDETLAAIDGLLPCLRALDLGGTSVTDAGVERLAGCAALERLSIRESRVTSAGLGAIAKLPRLAWLNLYGTSIDDEGLKVVAGISPLRSVFIWKTAVTADGVASLRRARPDLVVDDGVIAPPPPPPPPPPSLAPPPTTPTTTPGAPPAVTPETPTVGDPPAKEPGCCAAARAAGRECDHPCCIEARAAGEVCAKCLGKH